jgi:DNA-binding CsgD family transcriptional regulator
MSSFNSPIEIENKTRQSRDVSAKIGETRRGMERNQMPWKEASKIALSKQQETILRRLANGAHTPSHLQQRSQIILLANEGQYNNTIERTLKINPKTVKKWRNRYSLKSPEITQIEKENPRKLREAITQTLSDEPRAGAPPTYTDVQVATIITIACEDPHKYNLPVSHWTPSLLQQVVIERGIAAGISTSQIFRILKKERPTAPSQPSMAQPKHRRRRIISGNSTKNLPTLSQRSRVRRNTNPYIFNR